MWPEDWEDAIFLAIMIITTLALIALLLTYPDACENQTTIVVGNVPVLECIDEWNY